MFLSDGYGLLIAQTGYMQSVSLNVPGPWRPAEEMDLLNVSGGHLFIRCKWCLSVMSPRAMGQTARKPFLKEARNGSLGTVCDPEELEDLPRKTVGKGAKRGNGQREV